MTEHVAQSERRLIPNSGIVTALLAIAGYFGLALIPEWRPGFAATGAFFVYILSLPLVLLVLVGLAIWGGVGALASRLRCSPVRRLHHRFLLLALSGFVLFGTSVTVARSIRRGLPTGSNLLEFDSAKWRDPNSTEFVSRDITVRQKMLGDVVRQVLPGRSRKEIEAMLGPSLETQYFRNTGRDLIYVLGPERDSFFAIDSEWLLVWLSASGEFDRYEIRTD